MKKTDFNVHILFTWLCVSFKWALINYASVQFSLWTEILVVTAGSLEKKKMTYHQLMQVTCLRKLNSCSLFFQCCRQMSGILFQRSFTEYLSCKKWCYYVPGEVFICTPYFPSLYCFYVQLHCAQHPLKCWYCMPVSSKKPFLTTRASGSLTSEQNWLSLRKSTMLSKT